MSRSLIFLISAWCVLAICTAYIAPITKRSQQTARSLQPLKLFDGMELGTTEYAAIFALTIIPSLAFVKFVGDQADNSRGTMSENQKSKFKKAMMETPGINLAVPTSEEEVLKQQIQKAYMQDKDVDVAVLEEKLKQRIQWRKELQMQKSSGGATEDDDGW